MNTFIDKLNNFKLPKLKKGSHSDPNDGMCAMEMVAMIQGEGLTWRPDCVCDTLIMFVADTNDTIEDDNVRDRLKEIIPYTIGTYCDDDYEIETKRIQIRVSLVYKEILRLLGNKLSDDAHTAATSLFDSPPIRYKWSMQYGEMTIRITRELGFGSVMFNDSKVLYEVYKAVGKSETEFVEFIINVVKEMALADPDFVPAMEVIEQKQERFKQIEEYA